MEPVSNFCDPATADHPIQKLARTVWNVYPAFVTEPDILLKTRRHLDAAAGYLVLGMVQEANDEIEELPPKMKVSREVMRARVEIYSAAKAWDQMREVAAFLVREWPEDSQHWISLAHATRRCRSIGEAAAHLAEAMALHPQEPMIPFNLACYAAQTGRLDDARLCLARAISLDPDTRQMAHNDPDLEPLWADLGKHPQTDRI